MADPSESMTLPRMDVAQVEGLFRTFSPSSGVSYHMELSKIGAAVQSP
jgi:hypothetical protein